VIKKSDENLLNEQADEEEEEEAGSLEVTQDLMSCSDTQNLIDKCPPTSNQARSVGQPQVKSIRINAANGLFSQQTSTDQYSLLTTKITEEAENDDSETTAHTATKLELINKFSYLKFSNDRGSLTENNLRSLSMREASTYDHIPASKIYTSTSFSYNSRPSTAQNHTNQLFCNKDVVKQFCEKHLDKIRSYVQATSHTLPMPIDDLAAANLANFNTLRGQKSFVKKIKNKKFCFLDFECECKSDMCLYNGNHFEAITYQPSVWIHLAFLAMQARLDRAITQQDAAFLGLKGLYDSLGEKTSFVTLITSSFPSRRQVDELAEELRETRFFDIFRRNEGVWQCMLCGCPERASDLLNEATLIQGELKEKHGKYRFLRRWRKRLYSLTNGNIVYYKKDMVSWQKGQNF